MSRDHRKLEAFKLADSLIVDLYRVTRGFPVEERYGLQSQIRRAGVSTPTNIVEGCGCDSNREFARFLQHSINSADETEYHLLVARDYGVLRRREWAILTEDVQEVRKMVILLRRKVIERGDS